MTILIAFPRAGTAQEVGLEQQIAGALQAAPEDRREGATVMGYAAEGDLEVLRDGTNELICLADQPGDDKFRVACYHESRRAYLIRGRELRAAGIAGAENLDRRHQEADAGKLEMPKDPAAPGSCDRAPRPPTSWSSSHAKRSPRSSQLSRLPGVIDKVNFTTCHRGCR
jgi:hypothetical protein